MASSTLRVKRYVFDLDGTLFDTRERVRQAYLAVGVIMPDDAWGQPATVWLPEMVGWKRWKQIHDRKTEIYLADLRRYPPPRTTAASAMIELALSGCETYVITGATRSAAQALLEGFQPYHYRLLGVACDRSMKLTKLRMIGRPNACVYVDDDIDACIHMAQHGYDVVRYNLNMTKEEVLGPWAQSSLLPDVASG